MIQGQLVLSLTFYESVSSFAFKKKEKLRALVIKAAENLLFLCVQTNQDTLSLIYGN